MTTNAANDVVLPPALEREEVLLVPELAALLRMPVSSVYGLLPAGKIPGARKVGGLWRIHRATVVGWLSGQISTSPPPAKGRRR